MRFKVHFLILVGILALVDFSYARMKRSVNLRSARRNRDALGFRSEIGDSRTAESALFQAIMGNYRTNVRPVRNINDTVQVSARLFPIKIQSLKERDEILSMTLRLQLGWSDLSLVWNPADYGGLDKIVVKAYDLWLPDLQIANSAADMYQLMRDRQFAVKIHNNGEIWWHPTGSVSVRCELDLRYFPFDLQRCPITLESVIHTVNQLNLTVRKDRRPISFSMYTANGVWEMILATGHTSSYYVSTNTAFSRVNFLLYLHRRTSYYKLNIIFPCAMLSGLQLLTFLLPLNNQERVPQSTTILLSVVVFQTVVVEELPRTSNSLSLLSMYISLLTGISVASVADSVAIAYLISLRDRTFQVPKWAAVLLRVVCRQRQSKKKVAKPVDLFNNRRSSLMVKSNLVMDPLLREGLMREAPLACTDDYAEASHTNVPRCYPPAGFVRNYSPPCRANRNTLYNRSRSHQHISFTPGIKINGMEDMHISQQQGPACIANNFASAGSLAESLGNSEPSLAGLTPLSQRRRFVQMPLTTRRNSQPTPVPARRGSLACVYALQSGQEIIFVRWYKVARILNVAVFSFCLLLIVFVPVVLFEFLPPDVSQYKYFTSPAAASPPHA